MDYGFVHDGRVHTPNGTPGLDAGANTERNAAIERAELAHWQTCPDRMVAYYTFPAERGGGRYRASFYPDRTGAHVTTWPGTTIGRITRANVYRHNLGGRFVSLRVAGTNGAEYYGRASWDNGTCVVLRRVKGGR